MGERIDIRDPTNDNEKFYIQLKTRSRRLFLFVYDRELIDREGSIFYQKKVDRYCTKEELKGLFRQSDSINIYGKMATRLGIDSGYIHPEGLSEIEGIPCAIYVKI